MKTREKILTGLGVGVYGVWVYVSPINYLQRRYGESGLTWGVLVFGVMVPYLIYFVRSHFNQNKRE